MPLSRICKILLGLYEQQISKKIGLSEEFVLKD